MIMQHLNLNWYVECKHEGDDQETQEPDKANAMDNLMLVVIILLVCSLTYVGVPMVYSSFLTNFFTQDKGYPLAYIDQFWMVIGVCSMVVMTIYGAVSKNNIFYFITVLIFLLFLSARKSIEQLIGSVYSGTERIHIQSNQSVMSFTKLMDSSGNIKLKDIPLFSLKLETSFYLGIIALLFGSLSSLVYREHVDGSEYSERLGKEKADTMFAIIFISAYLSAICICIYNTISMYKPNEKVSSTTIAFGVIGILVMVIPAVVTGVVMATKND